MILIFFVPVFASSSLLNISIVYQNYVNILYNKENNFRIVEIWAINPTGNISILFQI